MDDKAALFNDDAAFVWNLSTMVVPSVHVPAFGTDISSSIIINYYYCYEQIWLKCHKILGLREDTLQ